MLKAIIANLDGVEKNLRGLYGPMHSVPHAGKYRLQVEPVDGHGLADLGEVDRWRGHATRIIVDDAIAAALDAVSVDAAWRDHFFDEIKARVRLVEDGDALTVHVTNADGHVRMNARGEPMTLAELAESARRNHPRCFGCNSSASGSDSSPTYADKYPLKPGPDFNLTEAGKLYRTDRALYERLKAEAESISKGPTGNPFRRETWSLQRQGELYRTDRAAYDWLKVEAEAGAA
jgi:hypothetical protein